ncbi:MAG TPA: NAD-dependent epimerase/dehydratase family protein [Acidimicrobiales bacterium]|nr:NAD-dependent epimerase/dehydratase family protein [Acidimicrobiales bacterium]
MGSGGGAVEDVEGMTPQSGFGWTGKRALVTGATGMVGSWLCRRLLDEGAQVVALVRDADPQSELVRSGTLAQVGVVSGRIEDYRTVERAINDHEVDTVFHLAAQTIVGAAVRSPLPTLEANVMGTCNVLEAARAHQGLVRRVVVASSDKAYGPQKELPYTEDTPLVGRSPYEVSKSAADLITQAYHSTFAVPAAIARCGNIFGGGDLNWSRIVPGSVRALYHGDPMVIRSDGLFLRDYIFVEDVVDAYLVLAELLADEEVAGRAFNFSGEAPLTVLAMYDAVCRALAVPRPEPVVLGGAADEIRDQYLDSSLSRNVLGWRPRHSLESGLDLTVRWYLDLFDTKGGM